MVGKRPTGILGGLVIFASLTGWHLSYIIEQYQNGSFNSILSQGMDAIKSNNLAINHVAFIAELIFVLVLFKMILNKAGVRKAPVGLKYYLWMYRPETQKRLIKAVHEFEHQFCESVASIKAISSNSCRLNDSFVTKEFTNLLRLIQYAIKQTTFIDCSIHIKVLIREICPNTGNVIYRSKLAGDRIMSAYEANSSNGNISKKNKVRHRTGDEEFVISYSNNDVDDIVKLAKQQASTNGGNKNRKNTAYDYVCSETEHYWMSNNLEEDSKRGHFYSTSNDYWKYYNSLAVFVIGPPKNASSKIDANAKGLLIIDSINSNVFHEFFVSRMTGYFAHRLHDFFEACNIRHNE